MIMLVVQRSVWSVLLLQLASRKKFTAGFFVSRFFFFLPSPVALPPYLSKVCGLIPTVLALYGASDIFKQSHAHRAFPLPLESKEETDVLQPRQKCTEKHFKAVRKSHCFKLHTGSA